MPPRPVIVSDHAYDKFQERFSPGLPLPEIERELQLVYRCSVAMTRAELKRNGIRRRKGYEYRRCHYRRRRTETVTLVMVVSEPERVVATVIRLDKPNKKPTKENEVL